MQKSFTSDKWFDTVNTALLLFITAVILYPLYFTVIASLSNPYSVSGGKVVFWVHGFTLEPYKNVLANSQIWTGYKNTIINTALVTVYNLALTIPCAYVLARRGLRGKGFIMGLFVFTMYFSGGMIPSYLLVKNMGLFNTRWALIVPAGFSVYNMIIARTFFMTNFSEEVYEAAKIDGANEYTVFFRIVIPLSGAIIAVIALYAAVGHWNSYFSALLYLNNRKLFPLQYVLRNILIANESMSIAEMNSLDDTAIADLLRRQLMAKGMKYSLIFIANAPIIAVYPLVQKHFVKGVMVGALKG